MSISIAVDICFISLGKKETSRKEEEDDGEDGK
jgi:hypothetical protein